MTENSTATTWGSASIEKITPVHRCIRQDGIRTAVVLLPAGSSVTEKEDNELTEIGHGRMGFRGVRYSKKRERIFIDFSPRLSDDQITNLTKGMLQCMAIFNGEVLATQATTPQGSPALVVQFSSS